MRSSGCSARRASRTHGPRPGRRARPAPPRMRARQARRMARRSASVGARRCGAARARRGGRRGGAGRRRGRRARGSRPPADARPRGPVADRRGADARRRPAGPGSWCSARAARRAPCRLDLRRYVVRARFAVGRPGRARRAGGGGPRRRSEAGARSDRLRRRRPAVAPREEGGAGGGRGVGWAAAPDDERLAAHARRGARVQAGVPPLSRDARLDAIAQRPRRADGRQAGARARRGRRDADRAPARRGHRPAAKPARTSPWPRPPRSPTAPSGPAPRTARTPLERELDHVGVGVGPRRSRRRLGRETSLFARGGDAGCFVGRGVFALVSSSRILNSTRRFAGAAPCRCRWSDRAASDRSPRSRGGRRRCRAAMSHWRHARRAPLGQVEVHRRVAAVVGVALDAHLLDAGGRLRAAPRSRRASGSCPEGWSPSPSAKCTCCSTRTVEPSRWMNFGQPFFFGSGSGWPGSFGHASFASGMPSWSASSSGQPS